MMKAVGTQHLHVSSKILFVSTSSVIEITRLANVCDNQSSTPWPKEEALLRSSFGYGTLLVDFPGFNLPKYTAIVCLGMLSSTFVSIG